MNSITENVNLKKLLNEYEVLFNGNLGRYNGGEVKLRLKEDVQPIFIKPRAVPFAYKAKLRSELGRLEELGIITKVDTVSWGTPLVAAFKPDGSMRVCAEYSVTVNKHLVDVNYPLPRVDDVFQALQGGQKFSKLDLSNAFNQLVLDRTSKKLLAWSTHKGVYEVNRLPFGCKPNS